jgi:hypothetical protein
MPYVHISIYFYHIIASSCLTIYLGEFTSLRQSQPTSRCTKISCTTKRTYAISYVILHTIKYEVYRLPKLRIGSYLPWFENLISGNQQPVHQSKLEHMSRSVFSFH